MNLIALIAALVTAATVARAETRFLNLSMETVEGRKVTLVDGNVYIFRKDGQFELRRPTNKNSKGKWEIWGKTLMVTYKSGQVWYYGPFTQDGQTYLKPQSGRGIYHAIRVVSIEAAD